MQSISFQNLEKGNTSSPKGNHENTKKETNQILE